MFKVTAAYRSSVADRWGRFSDRRSFNDVCRGRTGKIRGPARRAEMWRRRICFTPMVRDSRVEQRSRTPTPS
jgi:hypothetical protein